MYTVTKAQRWTGRILSGLVVLFMLADGVGKLVRPPQVVEGTLQLGYPESAILPIGVLALVGALLYALPRTAVLGAIVLTGFFGGAVATHLRVGNPLFSHLLFPVYLGALMWAGLVLRDARLRALLPFRAPRATEDAQEHRTQHAAPQLGTH
ncbi:DoxX family protein [Aggregicoccus sp. 17bor-14]|uniref:DoxX family protein n=1 Tax=Myxococcaceae TaxID=31 RepID=UPI00129C68AC|nr:MULTISPECIES: DoxX family protein [Myxococcaceae]MBF5041643.1 DoxX family protein [Simulacricoccus sp. 17bor-14]MRI87427.1 DoxX family protein [Aggregicoccus sp. 17bor-14]